MQVLGFICIFLLAYHATGVISKQFIRCALCSGKPCSNDRCLKQGKYQMGDKGEAKFRPNNDFRLEFTCKAGYKLIGRSSIMCDLCVDVLNDALPVCVSVQDVCGSITDERTPVLNETSCNCTSIAPKPVDATIIPFETSYTSNLSTSSEIETTAPTTPKFTTIHNKVSQNASDDGLLKFLVVLSVALFILLLGLCIFMLRVKRDILQHLQSVVPETKSDENPELITDREREHTPEEYRPNYDYVGLETTRSKQQLVLNMEEVEGGEEYVKENSLYVGDTD